ncbi:hypothetical protein BJ742DRAFT_799265 [Cladochytrium replicatum]|nr:hypothetical protein BJ742DRAFT_799265 [Cladochytrium replicatum]
MKTDACIWNLESRRVSIDTIREKSTPMQLKYGPPSLMLKPSEIEHAMREMDKMHGTSFYKWIRSEENIGYICAFKRTMFEDFLNLPQELTEGLSPFAIVHAREDCQCGPTSGPSLVGRALRWMSSEWSIPSIAELLLKLFYHLRVESRIFARLVAELAVLNDGEESKSGATQTEREAAGSSTADNDNADLPEEAEDELEGKSFVDAERVSEVVEVLLMGETPQVAAAFVRHFSEECGWIPAKICDCQSYDTSLDGPTLTEDSISSFEMSKILSSTPGSSKSQSTDESSLDDYDSRLGKGASASTLVVDDDDDVFTSTLGSLEHYIEETRKPVVRCRGVWKESEEAHRRQQAWSHLSNFVAGILGVHSIGHNVR